jgi:hypothetical protein
MVLYVEEEYGGTELVMRTMWTWPFLVTQLWHDIK